MTRFAKTMFYFEIIAEGLTGVLLLALPATLLAWLFGAGPPMGPAAARVAGVGLLAMVAGCWLAWQRNAGRTALGVFLLYNALVAVAFVVLGLATDYVGVLLWPVAAVHAAITALLASLLTQRPR